MAHRHTVLLVEDNIDTREAIAMLLRMHGYDVHEAADGRQALASLRTAWRPCLILLDVNMPIMDGFAFRRAQQADPALRDIPVAVLTALPRLHELPEPLAKVSTYRKPVDPEKLIGIVEEHCSQIAA
jgi:CheY-like chemotaxis protein